MSYTTPTDAVLYQMGLMALAIEIVLKKRADYAGGVDPYANLRVASAHNAHPVQGVNIRNNDKLVRVSSIVANNRVGEGGQVGEAVLDDLRDVINYACIAAGLLAEDHASIRDQLLKASERFFEAVERFSHV